MDYKLQFTGLTGTNTIEAAIKIARKYAGSSADPILDKGVSRDITQVTCTDGQPAQKARGRCRAAKQCLSTTEKKVKLALVVEEGSEVRHIEKRTAKFFLNRLCASSHGLDDAGAFNLLSIRPEIIADDIHNHQTSFAE